MQNLPHPWDEYARLQAISAGNTKVNSNSWGLEEEMNSFLGDPPNSKPKEKQWLERRHRSTARRERSRMQIREIHLAELAPEAPDSARQLEARDTLRRIKLAVSGSQWALVCAVAEGNTYSDLGSHLGISANAARTQVCRLRQQLERLHLAA